MHSQDYHDYVFKDGKLLGEFEEMYSHSKEIPWHQDKTSYYVFSEIDMAILKQYAYASICDIGCGLGFFTARLKQELDSPSGGRPQVTGIDVSDTAVKKASEQFPQIRFLAGDFIRQNILPEEKFELLVIKELFWYVCHDLDNFLRNALSMAGKGGCVYISQSFPATESWVGKEVIGSPERLRDILSARLETIHWCIEKNLKFAGSPHLHFLGRMR